LVTDEDKDLAKLLTGYQDMVGFLRVHKVAQTNSQVPKYSQSQLTTTTTTTTTTKPLSLHLF